MSASGVGAAVTLPSAIAECVLHDGATSASALAPPPASSPASATVSILWAAQSSSEMEEKVFRYGVLYSNDAMNLGRVQREAGVLAPCVGAAASEKDAYAEAWLVAHAYADTQQGRVDHTLHGAASNEFVANAMATTASATLTAEDEVEDERKERHTEKGKKDVSGGAATAAARIIAARPDDYTAMHKIVYSAEKHSARAAQLSVLLPPTPALAQPCGPRLRPALTDDKLPARVTPHHNHYAASLTMGGRGLGKDHTSHTAASFGAAAYLAGDATDADFNSTIAANSNVTLVPDMTQGRRLRERRRDLALPLMDSFLLTRYRPATAMVSWMEQRMQQRVRDCAERVIVAHPYNLHSSTDNYNNNMGNVTLSGTRGVAHASHHNGGVSSSALTGGAMRSGRRFTTHAGSNASHPSLLPSPVLRCDIAAPDNSASVAVGSGSESVTSVSSLSSAARVGGKTIATAAAADSVRMGAQASSSSRRDSGAKYAVSSHAEAGSFSMSNTHVVDGNNNNRKSCGHSLVAQQPASNVGGDTPARPVLSRAVRASIAADVEDAFRLTRGGRNDGTSDTSDGKGTFSAAEPMLQRHAQSAPVATATSTRRAKSKVSSSPAATPSSIPANMRLLGAALLNACDADGYLSYHDLEQALAEPPFEVRHAEAVGILFDMLAAPLPIGAFSAYQDDESPFGTETASAATSHMMAMMTMMRRSSGARIHEMGSNTSLRPEGSVMHSNNNSNTTNNGASAAESAALESSASPIGHSSSSLRIEGGLLTRTMSSVSNHAHLPRTPGAATPSHAALLLQQKQQQQQQPGMSHRVLPDGAFAIDVEQLAATRRSHSHRVCHPASSAGGALQTNDMHPAPSLLLMSTSSAALLRRRQMQHVPIVPLLLALDVVLNGEATRTVVRWECFRLLALEGGGYIHKSVLLRTRRLCRRGGSEARQCALTASIVGALGDGFDCMEQQERAQALQTEKRKKRKKKKRQGDAGDDNGSSTKKKNNEKADSASGKSVQLPPENPNSVILPRVRPCEHMNYHSFVSFFDTLPQVAAAFVPVWLALLLTGQVNPRGVNDASNSSRSSSRSSSCSEHNSESEQDKTSSEGDVLTATRRPGQMQQSKQAQASSSPHGRPHHARTRQHRNDSSNNNATVNDFGMPPGGRVEKSTTRPNTGQPGAEHLAVANADGTGGAQYSRPSSCTSASMTVCKGVNPLQRGGERVSIDGSEDRENVSLRRRRKSTAGPSGRASRRQARKQDELCEMAGSDAHPLSSLGNRAARQRLLKQMIRARTDLLKSCQAMAPVSPA